MNTAELLRTVLFVGAVGAVYLCALWMFSRSRKSKAQNLPLSGRFVRTRRLVYFLAILGILCFAYGRWIEPRWLQVTRVSLTSNSLPTGANLKIIHLSDLHSERAALLETRISALVAAERPDLIVFTGDLANSADGVKTAERLFRSLSAIAPTYAIRGNWDYAAYSDSRVYQRSGVTLLRDRADRLTVRGNDVQVVGAEFADERFAARILERSEPDHFTIFLAHTPDEILPVATTHRANLFLAGHIHGGQIALPFYGALVTLSKLDKRFESGLYRVEDTYLYVSRGIGTEGGAAPKVRFAARPEIAVISIEGTRAPSTQ